MRGVRYTTDGVSVVDVPDPVGDGVRVDVRSSGICSADLEMRSWGPRPVTLGHEFGGLTEDGVPVAVRPNRPCGACDQCLQGNDELCRDLKETIHGFFTDGGMADAVMVDPSCLITLPSEVDVGISGLAEPIAVALHALQRIALPTDAPVLVVGGGAIGLACAVVAQHLGHPVDVLARHPFQQAAVERLGAGTTAAGEYEVVVEAAGSQSALDEAIEHVCPGGTVAVPAMYAAGVKLGVEFSMKEVSLVPAFTYGRHSGALEFAEAVAVLAANPEFAATVITHRFPLEDAVEAFRVAGDRSTGAIKVLLEP